MSAFIWTSVLPACLVALYLVVRRPIRQIAEEIHVDHARVLFHQEREWLEARFLGALARTAPAEGVRWEDAHWHDEPVWARERQTRRLLALICVHFDADTYEDDPQAPRRHATALFEFRKGRWHAEGKRLDEVRPDEAVLAGHRFELVAPQHPHGRL